MTAQMIDGNSMAYRLVWRCACGPARPGHKPPNGAHRL